MPKFEILQNTICDGWANTWTSDDVPEYFDCLEDAEHELAVFLADTDEAYACGYLDSRYNRDDFRIMEVVMTRYKVVMEIEISHRNAPPSDWLPNVIDGVLEENETVELIECKEIV